MHLTGPSRARLRQLQHCYPALGGGHWVTSSAAFSLTVPAHFQSHSGQPCVPAPSLRVGGGGFKHLYGSWSLLSQPAFHPGSPPPSSGSFKDVQALRSPSLLGTFLGFNRYMVSCAHRHSSMESIFPTLKCPVLQLPNILPFPTPGSHRSVYYLYSLVFSRRSYHASRQQRAECSLSRLASFTWQHAFKVPRVFVLTQYLRPYHKQYPVYG